MKKMAGSRAFWIAMSLLVMAVIFLLSSQRSELSETMSDHVAGILNIQAEDSTGVRASNRPLILGLTLRKLAHVALYAALGFCLLHAWQGVRGRIPAAIACSVFYSIVDEIHQHFSGRYGRWEDILIDLAGTLAGIGAALLIGWVFHARRRSKEERQSCDRLE